MVGADECDFCVSVGRESGGAELGSGNFGVGGGGAERGKAILDVSSGGAGQDIFLFTDRNIVRCRKSSLSLIRM